MTLSNSSIIFKPTTHDTVQEFEPKTIPCSISVPIALLYSDRLIPENMIRDTVFMKHVCCDSFLEWVRVWRRFLHSVSSTLIITLVTVSVRIRC